jgi:RNA polymerase sigma-70 factor (ECF subfamily)
VNTEQIIEELYGPVHRFLRGLSRSSTTADDLAQETFLEVLRRDPTTIRNPRGYVMQVAYSRWVRFLRQKDASRQAVPLEEAVDPASMREPDCEQAELLDRVRGCLADVPAEDQALFMLVSVLGYSWTDAASILEMPRTTAVARHRQVVERMRWEIRRTAT